MIKELRDSKMFHLEASKYICQGGSMSANKLPT